MAIYQIYLVTNKQNNKKYVGQTVKRDIPGKRNDYLKRWRQHVNVSMKLKRRRNKFHDAIFHYGENSFDVELLEDNVSEKDVDDREQYYISYFDTFGENGYNSTIGGQGVHGYEFSNETRMKLSKCSKESWIKLRLDVDRLKLRNSKISLKLKNKIVSENTKKKLSELGKRYTGQKNGFYSKHHTIETKEKLREYHTNPICQFDTEGNYIKTFKNITEICRELHLSNNAVSRIKYICDGKGFQAYGYLWRYYENCPNNQIQDFNEAYQRSIGNPKRILKCDLSHTVIEIYESAKFVANMLNVDLDTFRKYCRNQQEFKGYIWKYE